MNVDPGFFDRLMKNFSDFFGDMCEIVVHDYRKGPDATVVDIINGDLSGRSIGDPSRSALIVGAGKNVNEFKAPSVFYFTNAKGLVCKSCTTFIADEEERIIGAVCINLNVTELFHASAALRKLLDVPNEKVTTDNDNGDNNVLVNNVDDVLDYFMDIVNQKIGKVPMMMSKEEKIRALGFLDRKGILKISKVSLELCQRFNISKFTLYNYIEEARNLYKDKEDIL